MRVHTGTSGVSLFFSHFVFYCFMISYFGHTPSLPLLIPFPLPHSPFLVFCFYEQAHSIWLHGSWVIYRSMGDFPVPTPLLHRQPLVTYHLSF